MALSQSLRSAIHIPSRVGRMNLWSFDFATNRGDPEMRTKSTRTKTNLGSLSRGKLRFARFSDSRPSSKPHENNEFSRGGGRESNLQLRVATTFHAAGIRRKKLFRNK
mmetsp:Transcript_29176/g.68553  ORF Transcript_29176/g.68553 Transcript_29176/m.68553 type:complete len:108 (-) Transcript_29176:341-664(-)